MENTAIVSQQLVSFLGPLLPYLAPVDEKAGQEASRGLGEGAWDKAKMVWTRLHPVIESRAAAMEAMRDASQTPEDSDALAAFRLQLKKLLAEDEALAGELAGLLEETASDEAQTAQAGNGAALGKSAISRSWIYTGGWNIVKSRANDK